MRRPKIVFHFHEFGFPKLLRLVYNRNPLAGPLNLKKNGGVHNRFVVPSANMAFVPEQ